MIVRQTLAPAAGFAAFADAHAVERLACGGPPTAAAVRARAEQAARVVASERDVRAWAWATGHRLRTSAPHSPLRRSS